MEIKEQILALRAEGKAAPYTVKSPTGEFMVLADEIIADFFVQNGPLPLNSDLDQLFEMATRVELRPVVLEDERFVPGQLVAAVTGEDLHTLHTRLRIVTPQEASHCMTWGDHQLEFFEGDASLASLELIDRL